MTDPEAADATTYNAEELLRAWFHWWQKSHEVPSHLPELLHVKTAAFLALRAVEDKRKIYGPRSL